MSIKRRPVHGFNPPFSSKYTSAKTILPFKQNLNLNIANEYRSWRRDCLDKYILQELPSSSNVEVKKACNDNPDSIFGLFQALRNIPGLDKQKLNELEATARACRQAGGNKSDFAYLKQKYLKEKIFEKQSTLKDQCQSCIDNVYKKIESQEVIHYRLSPHLGARCIDSAKRQITPVSKSAPVPVPVPVPAPVPAPATAKPEGGGPRAARAAGETAATGAASVPIDWEAILQKHSDEFHDIANHIGRRFDELESKIKNQNIIIRLPGMQGESSSAEGTEEETMEYGRPNYYKGAHGHRLGTGLAKNQWKTKDEWKDILTLIDFRVDQLVTLGKKKSVPGSVEFGNIAASEDKPGLLRGWGANSKNWKDAEGGGGQAGVVGQGPNQFGIVTTPYRFDRRFL